MAKVLVKANVAYPATLLATLEGLDRKPFGELNFVAEQDDDIPNLIYITFGWASLQSAREFWGSATGRRHVVAWQSVIPPEFVLLRTLPHEAP